jgi:putative DNA primase/helicase
VPLVYVNREFLIYEAGCYRSISDAELRLAVQDQTGPTVKGKILDEIIKSLATQCERSSATFARNRHLICCTNGTLDVNTLELGPHSPDHFLRTGLSIAYDPLATCPRFLAFLHDVFRNDADKSERIAFLQQWMGYMLSPTVRLQLMLWLVGAGANGKSVLLELMRNLVGTENCSSVMLDRLSSGAVRAELDGKTLNVSSDLPRNAAINDGYMKACVAGDAIDGERKFKAPFTFRPTVKFVASMNNMPSTNDLSHGFFRRIVVLSFTRTFAPQEQDQGLPDALLEELPGILAWAVEGLRTLQQTWQIAIPPSSRSAVALYAADSNPVRLFVDELVRPSDDAWVDSTELFKQFQLWCKVNGFSPRSIVTFSREFAQLGFRKRKRSAQQWAVLLNGNFRDFGFGEVVFSPTCQDGEYLTNSETDRS